LSHPKEGECTKRGAESVDKRKKIGAKVGVETRPVGGEIGSCKCAMGTVLFAATTHFRGKLYSGKKKRRRETGRGKKIWGGASSQEQKIGKSDRRRIERAGLGGGIDWNSQNYF